jgi:hypothetical protein
MIELDFSAFNLKGMEKALEDHVLRVKNTYVVKSWNMLMTHDFRRISYLSNHPYWSGQFMASWRIGVGSIDTSFAEHVGVEGFYDTPSTIVTAPQSQVYQSIYISNATEYPQPTTVTGASYIEKIGSVLHPKWEMTYVTVQSLSKLPFTFY